MQILPYVLLVSALIPSIDMSSCEEKYKIMGCYKATRNEHITKKISDRDGKGIELNWKKMEESVKSLLCRCMKKAVELHMPYFSINFFAECWIGQRFSYFVEKGPARDCINPNFKQCNIFTNKACVGRAESALVYRITPKAYERPSPTVAYTELPHSYAVLEQFGGFASWSKFSECSSSCGTGHRTRRRQCLIMVSRKRSQVLLPKSCRSDGSMYGISYETQTEKCYTPCGSH